MVILYQYRRAQFYFWWTDHYYFNSRARAASQRLLRPVDDDGAADWECYAAGRCISDRPATGSGQASFCSEFQFGEFRISVTDRGNLRDARKTMNAQIPSPSRGAGSLTGRAEPPTDR